MGAQCCQVVNTWFSCMSKVQYFFKSPMRRKQSSEWNDIVSVHKSTESWIITCSMQGKETKETISPITLWNPYWILFLEFLYELLSSMILPFVWMFVSTWVQFIYRTSYYPWDMELRFPKWGKIWKKLSFGIHISYWESLYLSVRTIFILHMLSFHLNACFLAPKYMIILSLEKLETFQTVCETLTVITVYSLQQSIGVY